MFTRTAFVAVFLLVLSSCGVDTSSFPDSSNSVPTSQQSGSQQSGSQPTAVNTIVIPLYSYPTGKHADQWQTLYNFKTSKSVYVIVNPSSGPGTSPDPDFTDAIATLQSKGFKVLGYVDTGYAKNSLSSVENQINEWYSFYPNINGIFLDDVSTDLNDYSYYAKLYNYVKSLNRDNFVVLNPGTDIDSSFFKIADKIIVEEDMYQNFLDYNYTYFQEPSSDVCIIITDTPSQNDFYKAQPHGFSINSSCQYITDRSGSDEYYYVSKYLSLY